MRGFDIVGPVVLVAIGVGLIVLGEGGCSRFDRGANESKCLDMGQRLGVKAEFRRNVVESDVCVLVKETSMVVVNFQ